MSSIVRRQFTVLDQRVLPEFFNAEYLEYNNVSTGTPEAIWAYGYYDNWNKTWVKLKDLEVHNHENQAMS